jgi:hypothetical protein
MRMGPGWCGNPLVRGALRPPGLSPLGPPGAARELAGETWPGTRRGPALRPGPSCSGRQARTTRRCGDRKTSLGQRRVGTGQRAIPACSDNRPTTPLGAVLDPAEGIGAPDDEAVHQMRAVERGVGACRANDEIGPEGHRVDCAGGRQGSSSSSTSRPPKPSASSSPKRCWPSWRITMRSA